PVGHQPLVPYLLDLAQLFRCPPRHRRLVLEETTPLRLGRQIANRRGALAGYQCAVLIGMRGVAAREQGWTGEPRIPDFVLVEAPLLKQLGPRPDAMAVEPPSLAAEDQVRAGNPAHARRLHAVAVIHPNCEGLWSHDPAEPGIARELLVPVDRIGIIHGHDPA